MTQKAWWWLLGLLAVGGIVWFLLAQAGNRGEGVLRTTPETYRAEPPITPQQEPATPQGPAQGPTGAPAY